MLSQQATARRSLIGLGVLLIAAYLLINVRILTADDEYWNPKLTSTEPEYLSTEEGADLGEGSGLQTLMKYKLNEVTNESEEYVQLKDKLENERGEVEQLMAQLSNPLD